MVSTTDKRLRHKNEILFFDKEAESILSTKNSFKLTNTKTHIEIFNEIPQLKAVVPFFGNVKGKKLLDLACGDGWSSLYFARSGAKVFCCDISPRCIRLANEYSKANKLTEQMLPVVMSGEELGFKDSYFDLVFVNEALHHLSLDEALHEIRRVLKKNGKAVFIEDFAYHPLFRVYRAITPRRRTAYERPLTRADLKTIRALFAIEKVEYNGLTNVTCFSNGIWGTFRKLDEILFSHFPTLTKYARIVGIYVRKR